MKRLSVLLFPVTVVLISACQAVFTYSPFSFLERDISTRPVVEQVARAREALSSGDTAQMAEAYAVVEALLETSDDPELYLLAADLAFGASGMTEVFTSALQDLDTITTGTPEDLQEVLDALDLDLISEGVTYVQAADAADAEVSDTQYIIAGAALLTSAVEQAGGFEELGNLTEGDAYEDLQDARDFLEAGGATDLLDMFGL
ncbi:MAG: hypothetical protein JW852_08055 [Spirochaetales bacterium]|nr:hypothetical protein [Spirochaetales bacterium]